MLVWVDRLLLALMVVVPIWAVLRLKWWGVLLGATAFWLIGIAEGWMLNAWDPKREGGLADGVWLVFGWAAGLLYALMIGLVVSLVRGRRARSRG